MRRLTALVVLLALGCSKAPKESEKVSLTNPHAAPSSAAPAAPSGTAVSGKVLEQIPAGGYRYLRLETGSGEVWAAVGDAPVEVGATVTISNAMAMERFESKTLGRTFDRIYFGSIDGAGASAAGGGSTGSTGAPHPPSVAVGKIDRATGPDARTIGELWAQKSALTGKTVTIRGAVVKYNAGVMGKNWIHLQDGSGDAAAGTHDITVTSMDATAVGTTVTITGIVRANRDFGAGYSYPLIIEDAKVVAK